MKISPDNSRSYPICRNCPQTKLTTDYIFDCKAILTSLFKLDVSPQDILYSPEAPDLASLVIGAFGPIISETRQDVKSVFFSSDEAHFWLNGYVNKQNCRIWREANPQVYVETPLHPEKLTVWCALWAGGIIGPYFFKNDEGHNVTVNGDRYRAMITNFFIHELNNHDVQELWFQQDGATCHTARATIDLLKDTFGDRLISRFGSVNWPPRSCDLTPLDYFLWGYIKSLVYADKPQTLDHLEDNIRRVIADIRPQMLEKIIENWMSRLDYIRASRGSSMPEIIFKMCDTKLEGSDDETQCDKKDVVPHANGAAALALALRYLEQQPDTTPADVLFMRRWRNYASSKRLSSLRQKKITELIFYSPGSESWPYGTAVQGRLKWLATLIAVPFGLGSSPEEGMDVCKCIAPLRHVGTLNKHRLVPQVLSFVLFGGRGREVGGHLPLPQNWGGMEKNRTVTCMVLKAKPKDRRKILTLSHNEFRGP
ncbi:uncharacterized protein TNCV_4910591 [Trichonephila clavipes]|nr:uncharacterized protein TNCV_4910591 [Trichonephila clavipes]